MRPWFEMDGEVVVSKENALYSCSLKNGKMTVLYTSDLKDIAVTRVLLPDVLVSGKAKGEDRLAMVNLRKGTKKWEIEIFSRIVAIGEDVLLCAETAERQCGSDLFSSQIRAMTLTAVSKANGSKLWEYVGPPKTFVQGVAVGHFFVVTLEKKVLCFRQNTGVLEKEVRLDSTLSLYIKDGTVLVWMNIWASYPVRESRVYSFTVPDLKKAEVLKAVQRGYRMDLWGDVLIGTTTNRVFAYDMKSGQKIWRAGQWGWKGVHDGHIFFSEMEGDGKHTCVQRMDVKTGKRRVLYQEKLPKEIEWKM